MVRDAPREDPGEDGIIVGAPAPSAAGIPGVLHAMAHVRDQLGVRRGARSLLALNQVNGFDCPGCAWPEAAPGHRHTAEFCENGAKAVAEEATLRRITPAFFAEHSVDELAARSGYWLGQQGRLTEPMYKAAGDAHYLPVSWDDAFAIVADELRALDSPDEAAFYTSGRTSNEAAFTYQLFVRAFGTNNLPDCSNMCHESSGAALTETIGVGKGSVSLDDFAKADLIFVVGQNPGTNHPRMLTALEAAKRAGTRIVAVNPLPEAGLLRFRNPQRPSGALGAGIVLADRFLRIRIGGDLALFQAINARLLAAEEARPGRVLDRAFIDAHTDGFTEMAAWLRKLSAADVRAATGLADAEIDQVVRLVLDSEKIIVCWAMGLTQHRDSVPTIREIVNFLLLRGNIGRPGAGVCPVRGHSNVQGDRTMGIWEKPPPVFLDRLAAEFGFGPPRAPGLDVVDTVRAMRDGRVKVFTALGGNFVAATPDSSVTEAAMRRLRLSVQVSTKLNRSHAVTGQRALILPALGRTEIDVQAGGPQFVTVEDSMSAVHASRGNLAPASASLRSEMAIICGLARATLGERVAVDWEGLAADYGRVRAHIGRVVPGCADFEVKAARPGGFVLPHPPRDSRTFPTVTGRARFTVNTLDVLRVPAGRLLLQTVRSHDQFNTTIYGLDDRYRGVRHGRRVVFVNPDDLAALAIADGDQVDLVSEWVDGVARRAPDFRVVAYPTAAGCAAAYFPETNVLVPLDSTARVSNTPTSKSIVIRLEPAISRRQ
ncbi:MULTISPECIES: FdhF/YdeP family oxidoreductase [unclassified Frankia]|uniref:FdhF/YdeP family oxidoreductase n=1 Tax=unclassified Frankia TaxID=2632575 RepID=UPI001EF60DD9|nr:MULTISPECIES: FdhF/YdeP family oxidoreductase [unclassified Frankia]